MKSLGLGLGLEQSLLYISATRQCFHNIYGTYWSIFGIVHSYLVPCLPPLLGLTNTSSGIMSGEAVIYETHTNDSNSHQRQIVTKQNHNKQIPSYQDSW